MARRLIGAVALLLALSGCGGDPKADPSPAPSTSPVSTTSSASPSAPAMPDAAKENSKAGAVAFVRHYIAVLNYAQATGDVAALDALEDPHCDSCRRIREYLTGIYGARGEITGGTWTISRVVASQGHDPNTWIVDVSGVFAPSTVVPSPGGAPSPAKGGPAPTKFYVAHSINWKVSQWTRGI